MKTMMSLIVTAVLCGPAFAEDHATGQAFYESCLKDPTRIQQAVRYHSGKTDEYCRFLREIVALGAPADDVVTVLEHLHRNLEACRANQTACE
jgi:hypothetical protein